MQNITETVKHLLIINIIFFIASLSFGDLVYDLFALHYPSNSKFQYWQPLTHMFMHGDFGHIFFNMFGLYMFGTPIEQMWGKNKFIFFYLSTGFGAAALQLGLYYYQIENISLLLNAEGLNSIQINEFFESSNLSENIVSRIGRNNLISALSAFNGVMVGASGACSVLRGICFFISKCSFNVIISSYSNKSKGFSSFANTWRSFFWIFFIFNWTNCTFCPCRWSSNWINYDLVLEKESI